MSLRLCLFWVKITSGNAFPEMRLFGRSGKFYFPENEIRWPKKCAFDHGNAFTLSFYLQRISGKWERERERARARRRSSGIAISWRRRDRDPARSRSRIATCRDRDRAVIAIATRIAIATQIAIAISDRDHGAVVGLKTFLELMIFFFWVVACGLCFLICVFLLLFQTPENIFRKIFWNATKHMETFSFSGN